MPTPKIFADVINLYLPEPHASLLNGIVFGIKLKTTKEFYQQLKMVGLLHIVVLSGMNITLLAGVISSIFSFMSKKLTILITILSIIIFVIFVGAQAPIVRAGIMGILTLVALGLGKKTSALYLLFFSFVLSLLFKPYWLKSISFQLSYSATLGIILFGRVKITRIKNLKDKVYFQIMRELKPSLSAQIFSAPLIFIYFKQISLISPIANLLVGPVIAPVMVFGFLTAFLGKIIYYLGLPFAYISF